MSPSQKWNSIILAVSGTIFARLLIGKLCDKYGPRLCYTWLLTLGAIPVIMLGLVQTPMQFMVLRFFVGFIGASFVITQFHTSIMFAPSIVGTANATSAGWGNLGGGANRLGMPLIAAAVVSFGIADEIAWRYSMVIAGVLCFGMGLVYYFFTQDTPEGNYKELKEKRKNEPLALEEWLTFFILLFFTPKPRWRNDDFSESESERFKKYGYERKAKESEKVKIFGIIFWLLMIIVGGVIFNYLKR